MKKFPLIARILLGSVFAFAGLNGLLHFMPMPAMSGNIGAFFAGLAATAYFLPFLSSVQTVSGILLLAGVFAPLALTMLAPVVINIFLFHLFLDHKGLPLALGVGALELYLSFFVPPYSGIIKRIFTARPV